MDEHFFALASALEANERADAIAAAQRMLQGQGRQECDACGELIPPERRAAAPFATHCLPCQAALEHMRAQQRSPFGRRLK